MIDQDNDNSRLPIQVAIHPHCESLEALLIEVSKTARKVFAQQGDCMPCAILEFKEDGQEARMMIPIGLMERHVWRPVLTAIITKIGGASRVVFVGEAWRVTKQQHETWTKSLADHPDRQEELTFTAEEKGRPVLGAGMLISRDADGKATLGELDIGLLEQGHTDLVGILDNPELESRPGPSPAVH